MEDKIIKIKLKFEIPREDQGLIRKEKIKLKNAKGVNFKIIGTPVGYIDDQKFIWAELSNVDPNIKYKSVTIRGGGLSRDIKLGDIHINSLREISNISNDYKTERLKMEEKIKNEVDNEIDISISTEDENQKLLNEEFLAELTNEDKVEITGEIEKIALEEETNKNILNLEEVKLEYDNTISSIEKVVKKVFPKTYWLIYERGNNSKDNYVRELKNNKERVEIIKENDDETKQNIALFK